MVLVSILSLFVVLDRICKGWAAGFTDYAEFGFHVLYWGNDCVGIVVAARDMGLGRLG